MGTGIWWSLWRNWEEFPQLFFLFVGNSIYRWKEDNLADLGAVRYHHCRWLIWSGHKALAVLAALSRGRASPRSSQLRHLCLWGWG